MQAGEQESAGLLRTPAVLHRQMLEDGASKTDRVIALRAMGVCWDGVVELVGGSLNSARVLLWKRQNPECNRAWARNWRRKDANYQRCLDATKKWRASNPDRSRYYHYRRACKSAGCQPLSFKEWMNGKRVENVSAHADR